MRPEAGRARQAYGPPARQQPHQLLVLLLPLKEREFGSRGSWRHRRARRPQQVRALLGAVPFRGAGVFARRAVFDLTAVDRVHGDQEVTGDEPHGAGAGGRLLSEVGCERIPRWSW